MNILIIGYGKMGKAIEGIALKKGYTLVTKTSSDRFSEIDKSTIDVAIEFSNPENAFNNVKWCIENNIPVVCGTTGWMEKRMEIETLCNTLSGTFFYASNFSIGVNLFFNLNIHLAKLMGSLHEYDVTIEEIHHTQKKDAPSGTAITLAEGIIENVYKKSTWINQESSLPSQLSIRSLRVDPNPGTHIVKYTSTIDDIEIKHTAHSREGFAKGAVAVSEWIVRENKKGILTMADYLKF